MSQDARFIPDSSSFLSEDRDVFNGAVQIARNNKNSDVSSKCVKYGRKVLDELKEEGARLLAWSYGLNENCKKGDEAAFDSPMPERVDEYLTKYEEAIHKCNNPSVTCQMRSKLGEQIKGVIPDKMIGGGYEEDAGNCLNVNEAKSLGVMSSHGHIMNPISYPLDLDLKELGNHPNFVAGAQCDNYREILTVLQHKYSMVLRKFEEINEQRMSYIEGLQELQAHLDNSRSVIQLQRHEVAKAKEEKEELERLQKQSNMEISNMNKIIMENKVVEKELRDSLEEKLMQIEELTYKVTDANILVDKLKEEIIEMEFMPKLQSKMEAEFANGKYRFQDAFYQLSSLVDKLKEANTTEICQEGFNEWVKKQTDTLDALKYMEALLKINLAENISEFVHKGAISSENRLNEIKEAHAKEIENNKIISQQLIKSYAARIHQSNADCFKLSNMVEELNRRISSLRRSSILDLKSVDKKLIEKLKMPCTVWFYEKSKLFGKPKFNRYSIFLDKDVFCICNRKSKDKFAKKISLPLKDIRKVEFGYESCSYFFCSSIPKDELYPWNFFTISTAKCNYNFICSSDPVIELWVVGLNCLIPKNSFSIYITDVGSMRLLRAKMKLYYHIDKHGITYRRMWLNAIEKTLRNTDFACLDAHKLPNKQEKKEIPKS